MSFSSMLSMVDIKHAVQLKLGISPEQADSFLETVRGKVFPSLNDRDGVRRAYLLRSLENEIVLLTFWNDKSAGDNYWASNLGRNAIESMKEYLQSEPSLTEYAVEIHEVNARDLPLPETAREKIRKASASSRLRGKRGAKARLTIHRGSKKKKLTKGRNQ
jgi:quinol monooxygenase YgiN